jgi:hypothetical protein
MKTIKQILQESSLNEDVSKKALKHFENMFANLQKAKKDTYPTKFEDALNEAHISLMAGLKELDKISDFDKGATFFRISELLNKNIK